MKVLNVEIKQYTDLETVHFIAVICEYFFRVRLTAVQMRFLSSYPALFANLKLGEINLSSPTYRDCKQSTSSTLTILPVSFTSWYL